jgi:hypothetical protein
MANNRYNEFEDNLGEETNENIFEKEIVDSPSEKIVKPFDPSKIKVESRSMTIQLIKDRLDNNEITLNPDFQRLEGIWDDKNQSRLIESMLIRIPLPAFYFDATNEGKWIVIDGQQRLSTLKRFIVDQTLRLKGLEFLEDLERKTFSELSRFYQRRILETEITTYQIQKGTPDKVKINIFKRINTGGLPLSAQEIRHALYQGKATKLLEKISKHPSFFQASNGGVKSDRMEDRELILRAVAFMVMFYSDYNFDTYDEFLNVSMENINNLNNDKVERIESNFIKAMKAASQIFGEKAFQRLKRDVSRRFPLNKALFEAWTVNLSVLDKMQISQLVEKKEQIWESFLDLLENREFVNSITQGTGSARAITKRFSEIQKLIRSVLSC